MSHHIVVHHVHHHSRRRNPEQPAGRMLEAYRRRCREIASGAVPYTRRNPRDNDHALLAGVGLIALAGAVLIFSGTRRR